MALRRNRMTELKTKKTGRGRKKVETELKIGQCSGRVVLT